MADNGGLAGDSLGGTFSHLLFSSNDAVLGLDTDGCFNYASSVSPSNPQKMLCFSDYIWTNKDSDSSSASSTNNNISNTNTLLSKSKKKRNARVNEPVVGAGAPAGKQGNGKKTKSEKTTVAGHAKKQGKKESIGERISALQQLVSPFGKTDTASVLHEAMGYIKFLQDQVQVLCSPYLQPLHHEGDGGGENGAAEKSGKDLRSKGLCLVPVESTVHVANNNGADFWLPAMKTTTLSLSDHSPN